MNISQQQLDAAEKGETVRLHVDDDLELVVVRANLYDKLTQTTDHPRDAYAAVLKALDRDDAEAVQYLEYLATPTVIERPRSIARCAVSQ